MKAIILFSLVFFATHAIAQQSPKKPKQKSEKEKVQETPDANSIEPAQNAVPIAGHKSTEPVDIELKVAESAIRKEEAPE